MHTSSVRCSNCAPLFEQYENNWEVFELRKQIEELKKEIAKLKKRKQFEDDDRGWSYDPQDAYRGLI